MTQSGRPGRLVLRVLVGAVAFGLAPVAAASAVPARGGELDEDTFEACRVARVRSSAAPGARETRRLSDQFEDLDGKRPQDISEALADADSKDARRKAFKTAKKWCESQDAYEKSDLSLPGNFEIADATTATISGTSTPGAAVNARTDGAVAPFPSATAGTDGAFSVEVPGLVPGENRIRVTAEAELHYPITRTIVVNHVESETAFKASCTEIPYDELVKDPDALIGRRIYSRAQVFQFDSRTAPGLLVSVTLEQPGRFEFWTDQVFILPADPGLGNGIDNDDIIEFWGIVTGALEYDTAIGGSNSVPSVGVKYMTLSEKREE